MLAIFNDFDAFLHDVFEIYEHHYTGIADASFLIISFKMFLL